MLLQNMSRAGLLRNVIVLGYVAFYQINKFLITIPQEFIAVNDRRINFFGKKFVVV